MRLGNLGFQCRLWRGMCCHGHRLFCLISLPLITSALSLPACPSPVFLTPSSLSQSHSLHLASPVSTPLPCPYLPSLSQSPLFLLLTPCIFAQQFLVPDHLPHNTPTPYLIYIYKKNSSWQLFVCRAFRSNQWTNYRSVIFIFILKAHGKDNVFVIHLKLGEISKGLIKTITLTWWRISTWGL